jgi:Ca2+/Na+ antiporter
MPDLLSSMAVARDGKGNMAVSNAVGCNVFTVCLGLGLPWFIDTALLRGGSEMRVADPDKTIRPVCILIGVTLTFLFTMAYSGFILKKWIGGVLCCTYFVFGVYHFIIAKIDGTC